MKRNILLILIICPFLSFGQVEEYPTLIDSTDKGGVTEMILPPERYAVNEVAELPILYLNINDILNITNLVIGESYTFTVGFNNPSDYEVILADVIPDCACSIPTWTTNTIAPHGSGNISVTILPSAPGTLTTSVRLFLKDPSGTIPIAIQRVVLTYQAQL